MATSPTGTVLPPPASTVGLSHYSGATIALMDQHGLSDEGLFVSKRAYLDKILLLVTDAFRKIRVYISNDKGPCIVGIALICNGIEFASGILSEDTEPLTLDINPERPVIESIGLQEYTWLEGTNRVEKKISYLCVSSGSNVLSFGQL